MTTATVALLGEKELGPGDDAGLPLRVERVSSRSHGKTAEDVRGSDWWTLRLEGGGVVVCCGNGDETALAEGLGVSPN